jgi:hypothetical protein
MKMSLVFLFLLSIKKKPVSEKNRVKRRKRRREKKQNQNYHNKFYDMMLNCELGAIDFI